MQVAGSIAIVTGADPRAAHPQVAPPMRRRTEDHDRWIGGPHTPNRQFNPALSTAPDPQD